MKKTAILMILCLMVFGNAFALSGVGYPAGTNSDSLSNQLTAAINGTPITLDFDSSADYSNIANSTAQMCFFAYNADNTSYVELYLIIPESVEAGTTINAEYCLAHNCPSCSITVNEVFESTNDYYTCFSVDGKGYPDGTDFEITITDISRNNGEMTVTGTFSAVLSQFSGLNPTDKRLTITDASFRCTIPSTAGASQKTPDETAPNTYSTPAPILPQPTKPINAIPV